LAKPTKRRREKTKITKSRDEQGDITTNTSEIQKIMSEHFENLYSNKLENLEERAKFLDALDLPKLSQGDMNHLNRSITQQ
jgi:RNA-binding protein YlmH